jgi:ABC-type transporter Mla subunit MlaD
VVTNNAPTLASTFSNLNTLSLRLNTMATNVDQFIAEQKPALGQVLDNAGAATADLKAITSDLREGRGAVGALLADEALRLQLGNTLTNFAIVSSNLARFGILYKPKQPKTPLTNKISLPPKNPWR